MRVVFIGAAIAAALSAALGLGVSPRKMVPAIEIRIPEPLPGEEGNPSLAGDISELLKQKDEKSNGATLSLTTQVTSGVKRRINVSWVVDYNGPRKTLIMLAPTMTRNTNGQTVLYIFAVGKDGKTYFLTEESPNAGPFSFSPFNCSKRDWFASDPVLDGMQGNSEEIVLIPEDIRRAFRKHYPNAFDAFKAPRMYVRMSHRPTDRGEHLSLDAWTGRLTTALAKVDIAEW